MGEWIPVVGSLAGVIVGFGGSYYLAARNESRTSRRDRALAVSEVLAAAGDVVIGTHAIRTAYYPSSVWRERISLAAHVLAAVTAGYAGATEVTWRSFGETRYTLPAIDRLLGLQREQVQHQRQVVLDLAALTMAQTVRFYSAVAAPPIRTEHRLVETKDALIEAVGSLVQNITAKDAVYERLRDDVADATLAFRRAGEALD